jgi:hypothetical protein
MYKLELRQIVVGGGDAVMLGEEPLQGFIQVFLGQEVPREEARHVQRLAINTNSVI